MKTSGTNSWKLLHLEQDARKALKFASSEGKKHGMPTEITVGPAAHRQFALSCDYPVLYGFLYYHLFANYLFDSQDRLVDLRAWIGLGATTPAMWLPIDLLLGSCFLIALLLLRVYKRLRIRLLRFYSWILCVSFAAWAATDISWRATGSIWMPSLRPLEYVFLVTDIFRRVTHPFLASWRDTAGSPVHSTLTRQGGKAPPAGYS